jgi:hypothetical protein
MLPLAGLSAAGAMAILLISRNQGDTKTRAEAVPVRGDLHPGNN